MKKRGEKKGKPQHNLDLVCVCAMPISEIVSAGASTYLSFAHAIPRKHAQAVQRPRALVWSTSRVLRQGCRVFEPVFGKVMIGHVCQSFSFSDDAMFELGVEVYSFATFFSPPGQSY